jgi:hypothetical protein
VMSKRALFYCVLLSSCIVTIGLFAQQAATKLPPVSIRPLSRPRMLARKAQATEFPNLPETLSSGINNYLKEEKMPL